ncbi:hypothetical protein Avbf_06297 [Armadillidium vulgare]|nr:hypothetical protein Avbf_06297 [Armadillidium vulgare]
MEKSVDEYLNEWGFSSVSSVFKDEGIDEEAFLLLTPEYVAKLIKGIGLQLKFINKLESSLILLDETSDNSSTSVLNVEYSEECRNVWTFFQRGNYDIIT